MAEVLSDQEAWGAASAGQAEMTDDQAWTPAAAQIAHVDLSAQNIAKAFGEAWQESPAHAFKEGFGDATGNYEQLGITPGGDFEKMLQNAGLMNDYVNGEASWRKAITGGLLTSSAAALDAVMRTTVGALAGTGEALKQAAVLEQKTPMLKPLAPLFGMAGEYIENIPQGGSMGMNLPEIPRPVFSPSDLALAKSAGVLDGEKVFFGGQATLEQAAAQHAAAEMVPEAPEAAPAPDIHAMARNVAPETFATYDRLDATRETLRTQLSDMQAERTTDIDSQIKDIQDTKQGGYGKIQSLLAKRESIVSADTPEMADIRQKLQETDYQMRDLAPSVSDAYRKAQEGMPVEEAAPEVEKQAQTTSEVPQKPIDEQRANIINDFTARAKAVGVSEELASAHAELEASRYETLAEQYPQYSAEEWYRRESADLKAGKERARTLAQGELGQFATPDQEAYAKKLGSLSNLEAQIANETNPARIADLSREKELTQKWLDDHPQELNQAAKGKIRLATDETKATITLMKNADASTLIHEKGHEWTDQLLRLSDQDGAPDQMKADAETLRSYGGANEDGTIPTRGHEKIARAFERYMMQGTAPSSALAQVFAKFRQWLGNIYQTVKRMNEPVSADIQDVFDRFLAKEPKRTVIAPDHEPGAMLANIHEADAQHTPPDKAEAVADNIRDEMKSTAKQHGDKEASDAIRKAEETHGSPSGSGSVGEPATDTAAEQPPAVGTGGSESPPEGVGSGSTSDSGAATTVGSAPGDTSPTAVLPKPKSDLVDKGGNIRLENLTDNNDVREVMRQAARDSNDFANARRGVVSDQAVLDLANAMGVDAKEINLQKLRAISVEDGVPLAVRIKVGRQMLVQSAEAARDAMLKAASGNEQDLMDFADARRRHLMIAETISGVTEEWGRAGRAFRDISKEQMGQAQDITDLFQRMTGKTPQQMMDMAKKGSVLDTAGRLSKFIHDSAKPSFGDMILEYWINGLISGPATHTTYSIGNTLLSLWKAGPETAVAGALGKLRELGGEDGEHVQLGEVGAKLKAGAESLPTAISAAGKALKTGVTTLLPGEEPRAMPFQSTTHGFIEPGKISNEAMSWHELGADSLGAIKGMRDAFIGTGTLVKGDAVDVEPGFAIKRSSLGAIPDFEARGVPLPIGSIIRAPGRAIAAIHSFFRTVNYSMEKAALAYRQAVSEGLEGNDFAARVGDITVNPSVEQMEMARAEATEATLMGQGGKFTKALSRLTNVSVNLPGLGETKLLKFIDPFVHISSNIIEQSILERTPIGMFSPEIRADLMGLNGNIARDFAQSRMLVGSALGLTIGGLAMEGLASGSGPADPKEAAIWRLAGNQAHSIRIGDAWYDVHRLGPLGMLTSVAADMYEVAHQMTTEDASNVAASFMHAVTQNILDESFMRGPAEMLQAVTDRERYGDQYIRNMLSSFVPFNIGLSQTARAIDPYTRQTRTLMDAIKAKIPYVSEGLYPRRDIWGQPMPNKDVFGVKGLSAIYETHVNDDPVNQTILRLADTTGYKGPSQPERKIRGIQLTDQQYDDYSMLAGEMAKMRLDQIVGMRGFSQIPPEKQAEIIKNTVEKSRETARSIIMMRNPEILRQATQMKLNALKGK